MARIPEQRLCAAGPFGVLLSVLKIRLPLVDDGADRELLLVLNGANGNGQVRRRERLSQRRDTCRVVALRPCDFASKARGWRYFLVAFLAI